MGMNSPDLKLLDSDMSLNPFSGIWISHVLGKIYVCSHNTITIQSKFAFEIDRVNSVSLETFL